MKMLCSDSHQLIRNVLAAHALNLDFYTLLELRGLT
jgi:hypothetical protein